MPGIYVSDGIEMRRLEFVQNPSTAPPTLQLSGDGNKTARQGAASHLPQLPSVRHSTPPKDQSGTPSTSSSPERDHQKPVIKGPIARARRVRATKF